MFDALDSKSITPIGVMEMHAQGNMVLCVASGLEPMAEIVTNDLVVGAVD